MRTIRFLWPPQLPPEAQEASLAPDQARHGLLVLRLKPGAAVEAVGPGGLAPAVVTAAEGGRGGKPPRLVLRRTGPWRAAQKTGGPRLALALIQGARFDLVVEKSVELGASTLWPLITERVKGADGRPGEARQTRWRRLAEEARKQCGRPDPLLIEAPITLAELTALEGPAFFFSLTAGAEILAPAPEGPTPLLAIGPEGGFSPAEEQMLQGAGFTAKSLGPLVLRSETAALAALARLL